MSLSTLGSKPKIYCFGNSHVHYAIGSMNIFDVWLSREGPTCDFTGMKIGNTGSTVWGLSRDNSLNKTKERTKQELEIAFQQNARYIMFFFGEVDVREHIIKRYTSLESLYENVDAVIERYETFLKENVVSRTDAAVILFGTIPYGRSTTKLLIASHQKLLTTAAVFNHRLYQMCLKNGFKFVSLYDEVIDSEGYTKDSVLRNTVDYDVHLHENEIFNLLDSKVYKAIS